VRRHRRAQLEHLAAEPGDETLLARPRRHGLEQSERSVLVVRAAVVEADRERLQLDVLPGDGGGELLQPSAPLLRLRLELQAVLADVDELVDAHDPLRVGARAAAHARDERVAAMEATQLGACLLRDAGVRRRGHDRRQDAVDVQQDRRPRRLRGDRGEQVGAVHRPRIRA
jgi:hypothetical protein